VSRPDTDTVYAERLYDLFSRDRDYSSEVAYLRKLVISHRPKTATWLDVACGTGRHLASLAQWFEVAGLEVSAAMLTVARRHLGPDATLHEASFLTFELDQTFDVVSCLSSSVCHAETRQELTQAVERMGSHVSKGGVLLIERYLRRTSSTTLASASSTSQTVDCPRASTTSAVATAPAPGCRSTTCSLSRARSSTTICTSASACSPTRTTTARWMSLAFDIAAC